MATSQNKPKEKLFYSPTTKRVYREFDKFHSNKRYMPVWNSDEIFKCCKLAYKYLDKIDVQRSFLRWCGNARFVLNTANKAKQKELETAIAAVADVEYLRIACGQLELYEDNICHRLMHIRVNEDFTSDHFVFASDYVADAIIQRLAQNDLKNLKNYLAISYTDPTNAAYRGDLFESYAHCILCMGGEFRIRPLIEGGGMQESTKLILPALNRKLFWPKDKENVIPNATASDYSKPSEKNFASADAMVKPNLLIKMSCSNTHPWNQNGLRNVLNLLDNPDDPCLFFVVPPDRYDGFQFQEYTTTQDEVSKNIVDNHIKKIKQFALEIDLTLDSAKRRVNQMFSHPSAKKQSN